MREMTDDERTLEQQRISLKLQHFLGQTFNRRSIDRIDEMLKDHRQRIRMRGLECPPLVAIVLPNNKTVDVILGDLDRNGIQTLIVNLAKKYPTVSKEDLAFGIGRVFPDYVKMVSAAERHSGWTPPAKAEAIN